MIDQPFDTQLYKLWKRRAEMPLNLNRVSVSGLKFIPSAGPALIAANHLNWKDVFFISAIVDRPIHYAATIELFDFQLCKTMLDHYFGQYVKGRFTQIPMRWFNQRLARWLVARVPRMGAIPVRRSILDKTFFERAKAHLRQGKLLCIFPEGGTARPGNMRRFKLGAAKLLFDLKKENINKIPVCPVGISGTNRFFLPGRKMFFRVGQPIFFDDFFSLKKEKQALRIFTDKLYDLISQLINREA